MLPENCVTIFLNAFLDKDVNQSLQITDHKLHQVLSKSLEKDASQNATAPKSKVNILNMNHTTIESSANSQQIITEIVYKRVGTNSIWWGRETYHFILYLSSAGWRIAEWDLVEHYLLDELNIRGYNHEDIFSE